MCNLPLMVTCGVVLTRYSKGVETGRAIVPILTTWDLTGKIRCEHSSLLHLFRWCS